MAAQNYGGVSAARGLAGGDGAQSAGVVDIRNEAGPWLTTLLPITQPDGTPIPSSVTDTRALVQWGAGGVRASAVVDWPLTGGTFVTGGDSLFVVGACDPGASLPGTTNQLVTVQFAAFSAKAGANRAGILPPRRSIVYGGLPSPGPAVTRAVPAFARRWTLITSNTATDASWVIRFQFLDVGGFPVLSGLVWRSGPGVEQWYMFDGRQFDVPSGAASLQITNTTGGAVAMANARVVYDLDIG